MKHKNNVTLQEVAEHAGVSKTTASVAFSGSDYISEETRNRVLDSAKELGYIYNRAAASLRLKHTSTVGLIIPDLNNSVYTSFMTGVNSQLSKYDKTILLGTTNESLEVQDKLINTMLENRVCGIILFGVLGTPMDLISKIRNTGTPVVMITRNFNNYDCDYIGIDDHMAGYLATEHLLKLGHKKIAYLGGISELFTWHSRKKGYEDALTDHGIHLDNLIMECEPTQESGYLYAEKILRFKEEKPTAIFCFNDVIAIGAIMKLEELNMIPGKDISLIGIDDIPEASVVKLTTVSSFPILRGINAADILLDRIDNNGDCKKIILKPELIIRKSTVKNRKT